MKCRLRPRKFFPGDTVYLSKSLPGLCPGWYRVEAAKGDFMMLSVGDSFLGTPSSNARHFYKDRNAVVDWDAEALKFQEYYCGFLRSIGQTCPHCEEQLRAMKERAVVLQ